MKRSDTHIEIRESAQPIALAVMAICHRNKVSESTSQSMSIDQLKLALIDKGFKLEQLNILNDITGEHDELSTTDILNGVKKYIHNVVDDKDLKNEGGQYYKLGAVLYYYDLTTSLDDDFISPELLQGAIKKFLNENSADKLIPYMVGFMGEDRVASFLPYLVNAKSMGAINNTYDFSNLTGDRLHKLLTTHHAKLGEAIKSDLDKGISYKETTSPGKGVGEYLAVLPGQLKSMSTRLRSVGYDSGSKKKEVTAIVAGMVARHVPRESRSAFNDVKFEQGKISLGMMRTRAKYNPFTWMSLGWETAFQMANYGIDKLSSESEPDHPVRKFFWKVGQGVSTGARGVLTVVRTAVGVPLRALADPYQTAKSIGTSIKNARQKIRQWAKDRKANKKEKVTKDLQSRIRKALNTLSNKLETIKDNVKSADQDTCQLFTNIIRDNFTRLTVAGLLNTTTLAADMAQGFEAQGMSKEDAEGAAQEKVAQMVDLMMKDTNFRFTGETASMVFDHIHHQVKLAHTDVTKEQYTSLGVSEELIHQLESGPINEIIDRWAPVDEDLSEDTESVESSRSSYSDALSSMGVSSESLQVAAAAEAKPPAEPAGEGPQEEAREEVAQKAASADKRVSRYDWDYEEESAEDADASSEGPPYPN